MKREAGPVQRLTLQDVQNDIRPENAAVFTQMASALMKNEMYQEAIDVLFLAIQCDPNDYRPWLTMGLAYYRMGRLTQAREALDVSRRSGGPVGQIDGCLRRINDELTIQTTQQAHLPPEPSLEEAG